MAHAPCSVEEEGWRTRSSSVAPTVQIQSRGGFQKLIQHISDAPLPLCPVRHVQSEARAAGCAPLAAVKASAGPAARQLSMLEANQLTTVRAVLLPPVPRGCTPTRLPRGYPFI